MGFVAFQCFFSLISRPFCSIVLHFPRLCCVSTGASADPAARPHSVGSGQAPRGMMSLLQMDLKAVELRSAHNMSAFKRCQLELERLGDRRPWGEMRAEPFANAVCAEITQCLCLSSHSWTWRSTELTRWTPTWRWSKAEGELSSGRGASGGGHFVLWPSVSFLQGMSNAGKDRRRLRQTLRGHRRFQVCAEVWTDLSSFFFFCSCKYWGLRRRSFISFVTILRLIYLLFLTVIDLHSFSNHRCYRNTVPSVKVCEEVFTRGVCVCAKTGFDLQFDLCRKIILIFYLIVVFPQ